MGHSALQDFRYKGTYNGGQNYATVLMYLSDVEEGGETVRNVIAGVSACSPDAAGMPGLTGLLDSDCVVEATTLLHMPALCCNKLYSPLQFFPYIPAPGGGGDMSFSECARDFLAVKPKKGRGRLGRWPAKRRHSSVLCGHSSAVSSVIARTVQGQARTPVRQAAHPHTSACGLTQAD